MITFILSGSKLMLKPQSLVSRLVILLALMSASCTPIKLALRDPTETLREFRQDIISSSSFSPLTLQAIRMTGLTQEQIIREGATREQRAAFEQFADPLERSFIEAEVSIGRAQYLEKKQPELAVAFYLFAADTAWQALFLPECSHPADLRCDSFKVFYDRASRGVLAYLEPYMKTGGPIPEFKGLGNQEYYISIAREAQFEFPTEYDSLTPSSSISLEGLKNRHRQAGIGTSLTACRKRDEGDPAERFFPQVGICLPVTALLRFPTGGCTSSPCNVRLEFLNDYQFETVRDRGIELPIAADFTAPFASIIDKTGVGDFDGLLKALSGDDLLLQRTGFYTMEPYNSGKIPLITVHGLFSSPLTWIEVHNDLMGDPVIRKHFQVWHYMYPTNLPILVNARTFRDKLEELNKFITEDGKRPSPPMVVISHSMGGILTRTSVVTDSLPLEKYIFDNPDQLQALPEETKAELEAVIKFRAKPYIGRVIFVAVPHRGSDIADNFIGRIGRWLISLPKTVLNNSKKVVLSARNFMKPELRSSFDTDDMSSVRGLSTKNPMLAGLSQCSISPSIPYHSIIGDQGKGGGVNSSDGVVPYWSSHLDGAESELIVPQDHAAHTHPRAIHEIRRILREHVATHTAHTPLKPTP
jgi:hypothetical protein